jgi:excinuclease UvrABC ATPase subunit
VIDLDRIATDNKAKEDVEIERVRVLLDKTSRLKTRIQAFITLAQGLCIVTKEDKLTSLGFYEEATILSSILKQYRY